MTTMGHKKGGIFCLRGGSDEGDALQVGGEEENVKRETPTATRASAADSEDEAWPGAEEEGAPFGGVALVTERSTATGGSKDRVSYSVLADGTLEVGLAAERKEPVRKTGSRFTFSLTSTSTWSPIGLDDTAVQRWRGK